MSKEVIFLHKPITPETSVKGNKMTSLTRDILDFILMELNIPYNNGKARLESLKDYFASSPHTWESALPTIELLIRMGIIDVGDDE